MRRVTDYKNFNSFENELGQNLYNEIEQIVEENLNKITNKQRKIFFIGKIIPFILVPLWIIIIIISFFASKNNFGVTIITAIISAIIILIPYFVFFFFFYKPIWDKVKRVFDSNITNIESTQEIYKKAFNAIQEYEYQGTVKYIDAGFTKKYLMDQKPSVIPDKAVINSYGHPHWIKIFNKYDLYIMTAEFKWETSSGKSRTTHYKTCSFFKLDLTPIRRDHRFQFSFFRYSGWFSSGDDNNEKIELENPQFNKLFKPKTDNPIKMRMMATPLYMENAVKRLKDRSGFKYSDFSFDLINLSSLHELRSTMTCDDGFLEINFNLSKLDKTLITKAIYTDIVYDIYAVYYVMSLISMSSYLED